MPVPPIGRRQFVASAGGTLFCTLAGHRISSNSKVDLDLLGAAVPVPPKVAAAYDQSAHPEFVSDTAAAVTPAPGGQVREYWIKAVRTPWDIVPTHHDGMMDSKVKGKTRFTALAYRPCSKNFAKPLGPPQIPGPLLEAETGDTIVVHFRNETGTPVTMHPHGIFYTNDMDGAYKGKYPTPSGFVEPHRTFLRLAGARRNRGRGVLPRPRTDGSAAGVQGPVRAADHPQSEVPTARPRVLSLLSLVHATGHRPGQPVLVHQRPRLCG